MSEVAKADEAPCGVVVGAGPYSSRVMAILEEGMPRDCPVVQFATTPEAVAALEGVVPSGSGKDTTGQVHFAIVVVSHESESADQVLRPLSCLPSFENTRFMVVSTRLQLEGVEWLTDIGRLDWVGYAGGLEPAAFIEDVEAQMIRFKEHQKPDSTFSVSSLFDQPYADGVIIGMVLDQIEQSLGPQPRITLPKGTRLTNKGEWVEEVTIIIRGRVALIHESRGGEEIIMHEESTGRIIGLLAVSEGRRALLNAVTTTRVTGVRLTVEQLNSAIQGHPDITLLVATLFIRSLDRRLRRAEALHIQNAELSDQLDAERAQLQNALSNLEQARTELSAQERLASLGALSAGVAHELNNPMAAIRRISQYLSEDVSALLASSPDQKWARFAQQALTDGMEQPSLSTREERALRRELTKITKDPAVSQRLALAGIHDPKLVKQLRKHSGISLEGAEQAASIGVQLRNLRSASTRITELVSSLRSYARPDGTSTVDMDLHQNLDDAVRLLSHKVDGVEIKRKYRNLPTIEGHEGQLAQVWTNIISNAAEAITEQAEAAESQAATGALARIETATGSIPVVTEKPGPKGTVKITTSIPKPGWVRVEITDDGPGIPEDVLPRIFEPRFTTKSGQVRFGMGIGLGVARAIVGKHHGTMRICTSPEGTTVVVDLPQTTPKEIL